MKKSVTIKFPWGCNFIRSLWDFLEENGFHVLHDQIPDDSSGIFFSKKEFTLSEGEYKDCNCGCGGKADFPSTVFSIPEEEISHINVDWKHLDLEPRDISGLAEVGVKVIIRKPDKITYQAIFEVAL